MRFLLKFNFPAEAGNKKLRDPEFLEELGELLSDIHAESAYFAPVNGNRGGYIFVQFDDPSRIAAIAEQFYFWLNAQIEFIPVMTLDDLRRAGPEMHDAQIKWMF